MSVDGEEVKYATQTGAAILLAFLAAERIHFQTAITEASARLTHAGEIKGNILLRTKN